MSQPVTKMDSKDRSSLERTMESAVRRLLGKGIATKTRLLTSLRVGSGAATLAALDGTDGAIMADGASAALLSRDRADATKYVAVYRNGTIRIATELVDLILLDPVTGVVTQAALGSITAGTNVTLNPAGTPTSGTRLLVPTGQVIVYFSMTAGAAIAGSSTLGTITTTAHRPSGAVPITLRDGTAGGTLSGAITSAGVILNDSALTNAHVYHGVAVY